MNTIKVGLILPSVNVLIEPEFYKLNLKGISFYTTRVMLKKTTAEQLIRMEKDLEYASELIASVRPNVVVYACTSGSFIRGVEWDNKIIEKINIATNCPAITASFAISDALKYLNIKKIAIFTPYINEINVKEKIYFENNGFNVMNIKGMNIVDAEKLHSQTPEDIFKFIIDQDVVSEAEGVLVSCTDFRAMETIDKLEKYLDKPVVTSNQAILWWLLKTVGYKIKFKEKGLLLRKLL